MDIDAVDVRAELVHRPIEGGWTVDALQLVAANEGDSPVLLRGVALLFPTGLRHFLPGEGTYPCELRPGGHKADWIECATLARELIAVGLSGSVRLQALFFIAPARMRTIYERRLSAAGWAQGWGPACYSQPFRFDTARWP